MCPVMLPGRCQAAAPPLGARRVFGKQLAKSASGNLPAAATGAPAVAGLAALCTKQAGASV